MVDLSTNLGRSVPTPREVLEVIKSHLTMALLVGAALEAGVQKWEAPADPDKPDEAPAMIMDGADQTASDALFEGLRDDAIRNVQEWAHDVEKVYDKQALLEFVAAALNECFNGEISDAVQDVLDIDDGRCEALAHTIKAVSTSESLIDATFLEGVAARLFQKV